MIFRILSSSLLAGALLVNPVRAFADDTLERDTELMDALQIIADRDGGWTTKDWQEFGVTAAKYTLITAAVGGAGTIAYYYAAPSGFVMRKTFMDPTKAFEWAKNFFTAHGGKVAVGVASPLIVKWVLDYLTAMNNPSEADRLRNASTPDARVYRSHIRLLSKLKPSERFFIVRQDPAFVEDVIRHARYILSKEHKKVPPPAPEGAALSLE